MIASKDFKNVQGHFVSKDDKARLFFQYWRPSVGSENEGKNLVLVHGAFEHSGRYENVIHAFRGTGVSIYSYDQRGHGLSAGRRGDAEGVSQYVDDLVSFLDLLREQHGVEKPVLLGHSMGGLVVLSFSLSPSNRNRIGALVTSGALISTKMSVVLKIKEGVARYFLRRVAPGLRIPVDLDLKYLSRDPAVREKYLSDPLVFNQLSVRLALDLVDQGKALLERANEIRELPIYLIHGGDDGVNRVEGTLDLYDRVKTQKKKKMIYPGLYHEVFNERVEDREKVLADLRAWVLGQF